MCSQTEINASDISTRLVEILCYEFACRDTLFLEDFKLADFVKDFLASRASSEGGALVPCYRCKDDGKNTNFNCS